MIGSVWHNIVLSTFISVYVFLLSLMNNTPQHSFVRALIVFVLAFILTYGVRQLITYILDTRTKSIQRSETENTQEEASVQSEELDDHDEINEVDSSETAEHIRKLMND
ncbi:ZIP family transporter [Alkalibacillus haloalkaliphilus]|uniref:Uncharacterized protein n=1 Tax=Alkalibacillus haloalkaliphilus TaxID=94136 RepID=A0A511W4J5_9BACI|nr:hypothetical protein [Alkalibacillus haloalkaliphilus]GEN44943.1 hypothetical protein AHA02nite_07190 [Alkalibacillus haloalkaliphilus]